MRKGDKKRPLYPAAPLKVAIKRNYIRLLGEWVPPERFVKERRLTYLSGAKAGEPVSDGTLRNLLTPSSDIHPGIDVLEALAHRLNVQVFELVVDWEKDGAQLVKRIMRHGNDTTC